MGSDESLCSGHECGFCHWGQDLAFRVFEQVNLDVFLPLLKNAAGAAEKGLSLTVPGVPAKHLLPLSSNLL